MSAKHTPGPWISSVRAVFDQGDKLVASVYGDDPECKEDERMAANSRLIGAAPELLEALNELEVYARGFSVSGVYLAEEIEGARLLAKACDAMAKATGEQQ